MYEYFKLFGQIENLRLKHGRVGGKSKNYGFVLFTYPDGLNNALRVGDEHTIKDCEVICKKSLLKDELNELKIEKNTRKIETSGSGSKEIKSDFIPVNKTFVDPYQQSRIIGGSDGNLTQKTNEIVNIRTNSLNVYSPGFNPQNDYQPAEFKHDLVASITHKVERPNDDQNALNDGFRFLTFETMSMTQIDDKSTNEDHQSKFRKAKSTITIVNEIKNKKEDRRENSHLANLDDEKNSDPTKTSSEKMPLCREDSSDFFATVRLLTSKKTDVDDEQDNQNLHQLTSDNLRNSINRPLQGREKFATQGFYQKKEARLTATEEIQFDEYIGNTGAIFNNGFVSSEKKHSDLVDQVGENLPRSKRRTNWN